jgi:hypothetical protein
MATTKPQQPRVVHTRHLSSTHIRELEVYYDAGGMNYWDHSAKPRGIYFASTVYEQAEGSPVRTLTVGVGAQGKGTGYLCVVPLDRYRPRPLREVSDRVLVHAETIHALCEAGDAEALAHLKVILAGGAVLDLADREGAS